LLALVFDLCRRLHLIGQRLGLVLFFKGFAFAAASLSCCDVPRVVDAWSE
jgi:hypothetical protein